MMFMKTVWRIVLPLVALLVLGAGAAWAQSRFSDVPDHHRQAADIEYAAAQGWFQGYEDGTFRPDRMISAKNALKVLNRAFPDGVTRADLATILRAGQDALAPRDAYPWYSFGNVCGEHHGICSSTDPRVSGGQGVPNPSYPTSQEGDLGDWWRIRYYIPESNWLGCFPLEMTVWLVDEDGRRTGDYVEIDREVGGTGGEWEFIVTVNETHGDAAGFETGHTCYWPA